VEMSDGVPDQTNLHAFSFIILPQREA
jgi:hypothetical protein